MTQPHTRVVVFSSATLFREGLCSILEDSGSVEVAGCTGVWEAVPGLVQRGTVDAVVIDRDDPVPETFIDELFNITAHIRVVLVSSKDNRLAVYTQSSVDDPQRPQLLAAVAQPVLSSNSRAS
jgi:DNA-binding NarL/FixJ family response regulator